MLACACLLASFLPCFLACVRAPACVRACACLLACLPHTHSARGLSADRPAIVQVAMYLGVAVWRVASDRFMLRQSDLTYHMMPVAFLDSCFFGFLVSHVSTALCCAAGTRRGRRAEWRRQISTPPTTTLVWPGALGSGGNQKTHTHTLSHTLSHRFSQIERSGAEPCMEYSRKGLGTV